MPEISGSDVDKIEMIKIVKGILIDLFRGYPAWKYYGIIEGRFKGNIGNIVRDKLKEDGFIDTEEKDGRINYWLTPKGVQIASPLSINKNVKDYGLIAVVITGMMLVVGLAHYILSYAQFPLF